MKEYRGNRRIIVPHDTLWLLGMSVSLALAMLPFSSYIASLPVIQKEWGMSSAQAGFIFSAYLAGQAASALFLVPLTDRIAPGRVIVAAIMANALGHALFPVAAYNFWAGSGLRFLAGLGHTGLYVASIQVISARFAGKGRGGAVGLFVSAGYAGTSLSLLVTGLLLARLSWRAAYLSTALAALSSGFVVFLLLKGAFALPERGLSQAPRRSSGRLSLKVLRNHAAMLLNVAYALHTAELYLARVWLPSLLGVALASRGLEPTRAAAIAATLAAFMFATGAAGPLLGGLLSDRLGRTATAALIFLVSGLCSFAIGWLVHAPWGIALFVGFVYGFSTAADSAIYTTSATELSEPGQVGSTQAVQSAMGYSAGVLAPVVAGWLLDLAVPSLKWGLAFTFNGVLAVVAIVALLRLRWLPESGALAMGKR